MILVGSCPWLQPFSSQLSLSDPGILDQNLKRQSAPVLNTCLVEGHRFPGIEANTYPGLVQIVYNISTLRISAVRQLDSLVLYRHIDVD
jgi:hypothetical protein